MQDPDETQVFEEETLPVEPGARVQIEKMGAQFGINGNASVTASWRNGSLSSGRFTVEQVATMCSMWAQGWKVEYNKDREKFYFIDKSN